MIRLWNRISLKNKIIVTGISSILLFALITMVYFIPSIKNESMNKKRQELRDIVDISASLMDALQFEVQNGRMADYEAENRALYYTGKFRYGMDQSNTVWIIKTDGAICSMPYREDIVGKNISALQDKKIRDAYSRMLELCLKNKEGFIEYSTQYKSEVTRIVPVISYVRYYEPYSIVIGSTVYIDDIQSEIRTLYLRITLTTLFITAAAILLLVLFASRITKPINDIVQGIAESDLNTVLQTDHEDEIGLMVSHFNSFVKNIRDIIIEIDITSMSLSSAAEELSAMSVSFTGKAEEQNSYTMEIADSVRQITGNVASVALQIDNEFEKISGLIKIMDRLSEIINRIDQKITAAVNIIESISQNAAEGEDSLKKMIISISNLENRSRDMDNIVTIINDISDRINLLSLNAAIEAARAGDAGRGFAVVADEISKLADATSRSINEISSIILDNDHELKAGTVHVHSTVKVIRIIMQAFGEIKSSIEELAEQIKYQLGTKESVQKEAHEIRAMSDTIRSNTREQKTSVMAINSLIEKINLGTEVISAGSEQLASGAEEVTEMSQKLSVKVAMFRI